MELYQKMGFLEMPFSTFAADQETDDFLKKVYYNPRFFDSIKASLSKGQSYCLIGARGAGKTALVTRLKQSLDEENVFNIVIDQFDGLPITNNSCEFLNLLIQKTIRFFCVSLSENTYLLKKLDKFEKEKLSFIIKEFFKSISRAQYEEYYNLTTKYKTKNFLKKIWNTIFNRPVNLIVSGSIEIVSDSIRKSLGLTSVVEDSQFYKNYLPEIPLEEILREKNPEKYLNDIRVLKDILNDLTAIIKSAGYKTTIYLFDKIDEYNKLNTNVSLIAEFLLPIFKDTSILVNPNYGIVFSIWNVLKPMLTSGGARLDKIAVFDISWSKEDLVHIMNKRTAFYSGGKLSIKNIIKDENKIDYIISLSNYSPRYLFKILSIIYTHQSIQEIVDSFQEEAINQGMLSYAKSFEFYIVFPGKRNTKEDILVNVNRMLKVGKIRFKTKDYSDVLKVSAPTAMSYVQILKDYDLIVKLTETENGAALYEIKNPIVQHLIRNSILEVQN